MDTILNIAIAVAGLTVLVGFAAIWNAIRVNQRKHARARVEQEAAPQH